MKSFIDLSYGKMSKCDNSYSSIYEYKYICSPMQLLWANSTNCMMCDCWILRNTKIVDYLKCIHWFLFVVENLGLKFAVPLSMDIVTDITIG